MSGDVQVRFCERPGVRFPRATHPNVYVRSERAGQRVMASLVRFIEKRLRLRVNRAKSAVARPGSRHLVGFRLPRRKDGSVSVRLSERSRKRIDRKVVELTPRNWGGSLESCIERLNQYLECWIGFFHVCSEVELHGLSTIDAHIRRRLRAIVLRHKKRRRHLLRWYLSRGVPAKIAGRDVYGRYKSHWALSATEAAHRSMTTKWFGDRGLLPLKQRWRQLNSKRVKAPDQLELVLA